MSKTSTSESTTLVCANCGKEGGDVTNTCNKCNSVMYCNAACKKRHRHKHKNACEEHVKRAAEHAAKLHDETLFKQPPRQYGDCPICFLRLPIVNETVYMACCGKVICCGCVHAFQSRAAKAGRSKEDNICPFCRTPPAACSDEDLIKRYEKRMELNDAQAIRIMGVYYSQGLYGLRRNRAKALELWHRAADLGDAEAYYAIANAYCFGEGVGVDEKKAIHYYEFAAMMGDEEARYNLGVHEERAGEMGRALKHYMIAVKDGDSNSLKRVRQMFKNGSVTKDIYTKALRSYQAYLDEIKSDQRDEAAAADAI